MQHTAGEYLFGHFKIRLTLAHRTVQKLVEGEHAGQTPEISAVAAVEERCVIPAVFGEGLL